MPIYPYRCRRCQAVTDLYWSNLEPPEQIRCDDCTSKDTHRIIGANAYHRSDAQKTARLDPRYDKMVDAAAKSTPSADEQRLLRRLKPFK